MNDLPLDCWYVELVKDNGEFAPKLYHGDKPKRERVSGPPERWRFDPVPVPEFIKAEMLAGNLSLSDLGEFLSPAGQYFGLPEEAKRGVVLLRTYQQNLQVFEAFEHMREALRWYARHVGNVRRTTPVGDVSRQELDADRGDRARSALQLIGETE